MPKRSNASAPQAIAFRRPVTVIVEAKNRRTETVKILPGGPTGNQFEVVMGMDFAPVLPQRILLPLMPSAWDQAFMMIAAAAAEPAIPAIPFVQPKQWRRARVHLPDFAGHAEDSVTVTVDSRTWCAKLVGTSRAPAEAVVPEGSMRFLTVGWILAEMTSKLALERPAFAIQFALQAQPLVAKRS